MLAQSIAEIVPSSLHSTRRAPSQYPMSGVQAPTSAPSFEAESGTGPASLPASGPIVASVPLSETSVASLEAGASSLETEPSLSTQAPPTQRRCPLQSVSFVQPATGLTDGELEHARMPRTVRMQKPPRRFTEPLRTDDLLPGPARRSSRGAGRRVPPSSQSPGPASPVSPPPRAP